MGQREPEPAAHDPGELRRIQRDLHETADGLVEFPAAFDVETVGHAGTASMINQVMSDFFKRTANLTARLRRHAEAIDPEAGAYGGVPNRPAPARPNRLIRPGDVESG